MSSLSLLDKNSISPYDFNIFTSPGHCLTKTGRRAILLYQEVFSMISLKVNKKEYEVDVSPDTPLLWVLREKFGLTGTKYGCGLSLCGSCTVIVNGEAIRSCTTPVKSVLGKEITTIEGLSADTDHPLQKAWIARGSAPVRILPVRPGHGSCSSPCQESQTERYRHR